MLEELEIRNLGPIRHALIEPAAGMTAITGETGAGKSMLLNALRLISGDAIPAQKDKVSAGADAAWAQGVFTASEGSAPARMAQDAGVDAQDGELYLTRTVPVKGRSRAVLGGHSVPRSVLSGIAGSLFTIHGQADQLRIASPVRQREFLDAVADDMDELAAYRAAWDALHEMDERLAKLTSQEASARQRADYLRESIERIERVDPKPGEDEELKARRARIENAAQIMQGVGGALAALDISQVPGVMDDEAVGATDLINRAVQSLRAIRVDGDFGELADRLESINADLADVVFSLTQELDDDENAGDLDEINGRIHELDELVRRWGPTLADVIAWRDKAAFEVEDLDASPEKVAELTAKRERLEKEAYAAADVLSAARAKTADWLSGTVTGELGNLAMAGASLAIRVTPGEKLDASGRDEIEFLFTPFPGSPQLQMGKSASGGELSRLMLAMELAAADRRAPGAVGADGDVPMTFIFDEVDAGVGGKAAVELGRRLAALAKVAQVIVVTHLAQVASWADAQFVVRKGVGSASDGDGADGAGKAGADAGAYGDGADDATSGSSSADGADGVVSTTVTRVDGEGRVREIARMLSGSESETSLDHARELLKESRL